MKENKNEFEKCLCQESIILAIFVESPYMDIHTKAKCFAWYILRINP